MREHGKGEKPIKEEYHNSPITHTDLESLKLILSRIKILWPLIRPVLTYEAKLLPT